MRVRRFWLRLFGGGLTLAWTAAAGLVLLGYRPGGPWDVLVGVAAVLPICIAMASVVWPPTARGDRAFAIIAWLAVATGLVLLPSIGGFWNQIQARGAETLLPSFEAAYPWLLALLGTSLFAGLGIARRQLGEGALRTPRPFLASAIALVLTASTASIFAAVAIGNDVALRDRPAAFSRFGPTDPHLAPPACDDPIERPRTAHLTLELHGEVDRRSIGSVTLAGERSGTDIRWSASVATSSVFGQVGAARVGASGWRNDGARWVPVPAAGLDADTLDSRVLDTILAPAYRPTFEEHGIEFVEGARARHCRIAIDGPTFRAAFPQVAWLAGSADLHRWRGELDYWLFGDGELGQLSASINGDAAALEPAGIQGTIQVRLTATFRDRALQIEPPVGP